MGDGKTAGMVERNIPPDNPVAHRSGDSMTHRLLSFALALSCVRGVDALTPSISFAAEPAQRIVRLGFVGSPSASSDERGVDAFWERLRELGWVKGQNLVVEQRWAEGHTDRLPALVTQVIERKVDVLVTYGTPGAVAAKNATKTIPIVVPMMADPIRSGLTTSLAHPDGNLTGLSLEWDQEMAGKWLELLQRTIPHLSAVAMIANIDNPSIRERATRLQAIAPRWNIRPVLIEVRNPEALSRAFKQARKEAQAALLLGDVLTFEHRRQVTALAATYRLPTMYPLREYADSGGLMAYGADRVVMFRRAAEYVDKILRGTKPSDLPIEQPTKFELVVNLKAAKALGITIPESILLRADEVIR